MNKVSSSDAVADSTRSLVYTVLIPVMNEVDSLNKTISIILEENNNNFEIIIILSPKTKLQAKQNALKFENIPNLNAKVVIQSKPGIGGAYQDGIELSSGNFIIMIASDLETDPHLVRELIFASVENPEMIIATTRWKGLDAGFLNYGNVKYILNWTFQKMIRILFRSSLTDYTFGFRLYPTNSLKGRSWKELNFAFLLESILIPIREGWKVTEIPHAWKPRIEEKSSNKFIYYFDYFKVAYRVRRN